MTQDEFPSPNDSIPIVDIQYTNSEQGITMRRTYPVKQSEEELNDFMVEVRASILVKSRERMKQIKENRIPIAEILLGVSTTIGGSILGAIAGGVTYNSFLGILFYIILSPIATGSFIAYLFYHNSKNQAASNIAQEVLRDLPDPNRAN